MEREIERIFANRRKSAEIDLDIRMNRIHLELPELKELESDISKVYANLAKAKILGDLKCQEELREKLELLKKNRLNMISSKDITEGDLKIKYNCSKCEDTGYINNYKGRIKCDCLKLEEAKLLYKNSNMFFRLNRENFEKFDMNLFDNIKRDGQLFSQRENMEEILSDIKVYIQEFDSINERGLIFTGGVGLGKSFLCSCIGKELIDKGKTVIYYSAYDIMKLLSTVTFEKDVDSSNFNVDDFKKINKVDLLIIDDLGAELTNNFVTSELFNVINSRIIKGKSTIISTNLYPEDLRERYGERIYSRFSEYFNFYRFIGSDLRMRV
ncbi:MAG: ATP-binding protein [Filifactoraceae bacterium]